MIRCLDFIFAAFGLLLLSPFFIIIFFLGYLDTGAPFFKQLRVGRNKTLFALVKFRSMRLGAKSTPTHLADPKLVTSFGKFLRRSKLDELPQLWNVLVGDMSLVGPRPNLPIQEELIVEREKLGVYLVRPGITGLAQINKIDMSTPALLAQTDAEMIHNFSVFNYLRYILSTITGSGLGDRINSNI